MQFSPEAVQSEMFIHDPKRLSLDYTKKLMGFLLFVKHPDNITIIGLGGGSIPKYCYHSLPSCTINVAEINFDVIALRKRFFIPDDDNRFKIHCCDGAKYITNKRHSEDVIVVDGFDTRGQPAELCSEEFYQSCRDALTDTGVMAVNLSDDPKKHGKLINRIRRSFSDAILVLNSSDCDNKVVFAFKNPYVLFARQELQKRANFLEPHHSIFFQPIVERLITNRHNEKIITNDPGII